MTAKGRLRRAAAYVAACCALLALPISSCTDSGITGPSSRLTPSGASFRASLALNSRVIYLGAPNSEPVNFLRARVYAADGTILGSIDQDLDPAKDNFGFSLNVSLPSAVATTTHMTLELANRAAGGEIVQYSGRVLSLPLAPGDFRQVDIDLYPGPLDNFDVRAVHIAKPLHDILEGDSLLATATIVGGGANARIIWSSLDGNIASIGGAGEVTGKLPGQARIVAAVGTVADTAVVTVLPRRAAVVVTPPVLEVAKVGDIGTYTAAVIDSRGTAIAGEPITWSIDDSRVGSLVAGGTVQALRVGETTVRATSINDPTLSGTAVFRLRAADPRVAHIDVTPAEATVRSVGATQPFVATARDGSGNVLPNVQVTWTSSAPSVATVNSSGTATAAASGTTSIVATADTVSGSATLHVVPVATNLVVVSGDGQRDTVGKTTSTPLVVRAVDANGNPAAGATVRFAADGDASAVATAAGISGPDGIVETRITLGHVARAYHFVASADSIAGSGIVFEATAVPGAAASLVLSREPSSPSQSRVVFATQPIVGVVDTFGNQVLGAGISVAATLVNGRAFDSTATTDATGNATFASLSVGGLIGAHTLTFVSPGLRSVTTRVTLTAGVPASIQPVDTVAQSAQVGTGVAVPPSVLVTDADGNAVAGASVTFTVTAGDGTITSASVVTDSQGIATVGGWTLGTTPGVNTVTASVGSMSATFNATATPIPAARYVVTSSAATATVGTSVTITAQLADAQNNPVTTAGRIVTWTSANGGHFSAPTSTTNANGQALATFTTSTTAGVVHTVTATDASSITGTSGGITTVAGAPSAATSTIAVGSAALAASGTTTITVTVRDAYGNIVTTATPGSISLSASTGSIGTVTCTNGVCTATFTAPATSGTANVAASIGGTAITNPPAISISSVPAAVTALTATRGNAQVALSWTAPANNGSAISDYLIEFKPTSGSTWSTFSHTASTATAITVTGLTNGTSYDFRVSAVNGNGTGAASGVASATPATTPDAPTALTGTAGSAQVSLTWSAPVNDGGSAITNYVIEYSGDAGATWSTFSHAASATPSITVTGLTNGTAYEFRVSAVSAIGTSVPSATASVAPTAGLTPRLSVTAGNNQSAAAGSAVAVAPSVTATDANGNPVAGVSVTFAVASGGGQVTGASVNTNASGVATVGGWTLGTAVGANSLSASAIGYTSATIDAAAIAGAPSATMSTLALGSSALTVGGTTTITVTLKDAHGNVVTTASSSDVALSTDAGSIGTVSCVGGVCTATFTAPANATTATISARIGAANISGSPATITVTSAPGAPTGLTPTVGNAQIALAWTAPTSTGGSTITNYIVEYSADGGATWSTFSHAASTTPSITVSGLTNGTSYEFRVSAVNAVGTSSPSATTSATPTAGLTPSLSVTAGNNQSAAAGSAVAIAPSVTATDANGNPVTGVSVTFSVTTGNGQVTGTPATTNASGVATVGSWTLGNTTGSNSLSASAVGYSSATINATAVPGSGSASTSTLAIGSNALTVGGTTTITVTLKDAHGNVATTAAATDFALTTDVGSIGTVLCVNGVCTATFTAPASAATATVTAKIGASNISGSPATITVTSAPGAPTALTATVGNGQVALAWTAPASTGGSAITNYVVEYTSDGGTTWSTFSHSASTTTSITVTGLTNGASYEFRVSAVNAVGTSTPSSTVNGTPTAGLTPTLSVTAGNNQSAAAGSPVAIAPSVTATDANGNPVVGLTVTFSVTTGNGQVTGTPATTNASGVATLGSWTLGTTTGANSLSATATGYASATINATAIPGAPSATTSTLTVGGTALTVGGTTSITVTLKDAHGNTVTAATASDITLATDVGSIGTVSCTNGVCTATFTAPASSGTATIAAKTGGNNIGGSPATIAVSSAPGAPTALTPTIGNGQIALAWTTPASNGGSPITNYVIEYSSDAGTTWTAFSHSASTATSIIVTGLTNGSAYEFRVSAVNAVGTSSPSATANGTPTAGLTPRLSVTAGNNQSAAAGSAVAIAPSVTATDANNNPVAGLSVTFSVTTGNGHVTGATATTGALGVATIGSWTLGNTTGANSLTAAAVGYTSATIDATAIPGAPSATTSALAVGSAALTVGGTTSITVTVKDADGNVVTNASSSDVALSADAGSIGTVSCVSGVCTATFTAPASAATATISAKIGTASISGSPATITVTSAPGTPTAVSATSGASQVNLSWTAPANDGGSAITNYVVEYTADGGTTWSTFSHSASTTTSITVTGLTNGTTYEFRVAAVNAIGTSVPSATASVAPTAGLTPRLSVTAGNNQSAAAGSAVAIAPSVTATDANNNPVVGLTVTFSVTTGNGQVTGTPATTNASGVATLGSWTLGNATGANSLTAAATGYTSATINATATPGAPSATTSTLAIGSTALTVGGTTSITVTLKDAHGNVATTAAATDVALSTDAGSIGTVSCVSGVCTATFTAPASSGTATITAKIGASNISGSPATIAVTSAPGAPTALTPTIGNGQVALAWTAPTSTGGSAITNYIVEYSSDGGTTWSTFSHSASTSPSITVTGLTNGTSYEFRVSAVNAVGTSSPSSTANGTPTAGLTPSLSVTAGNNQSAAAGSAVAIAPSVTATDANGNPVVGLSVTFAVTTGGGQVTGTPAVTNASGVATVGSWTLGTAIGANSLSASAVGYSPATIDATAVPGAASASTSALAIGSNALTVGGTTSITVTLKDAHGNTVTAATASDITLGTDAGSIGTVSCSNGVCTATFTAPASSGIATITAKIGASNISGSPATITVTSAPGAPTALTPTVGNGQIALTWTAPASTGGSAITNYIVEYSADGGTAWSTFSHTASTATSITVTGLTNGTTYQFRVSAVNAIGTSAPSATANGTPTAGLMPTLSVTAGNNQSAAAGSAVAIAPSVTATDANGNPVAGVSVTFSVATGGGQVTGTPATTSALGIATVGSWKLGNSTGSNSLTASAVGYASATIDATAIPGAASATTSTLAVGSTALSAGGTTSVTVTLKDALNNTSTSATPSDIALTVDAGSIGAVSCVNGVCTATFTAPASAATATISAKLGSTNIGGSPATIAVTSAPGAPTALTPTVGNAQIALAWTAPASNGGSAITNYVIEYSSDGGNTWATFSHSASAATSITVTGLTNGTAYEFRVFAVNAVGTSSPSSTANGTPTAGLTPSLSVTAGNNQSAAAGSAVTVAPSVTATDANGNPVVGLSVTFAVTTGGGQVTGATINTNASGVATVGSWTLGNTTGSNSLTASAVGYASAIVDATAIPGAPSATTSTLTVGSTALTVGGTTTVTVTVKDAHGNVVTTAAANDVALSTDAGSIGTISCISGVCTATFTAPASAATATISAKIGASNISGSPATISVTSAPGAPTALTPTIGNGQVALAWTAPASNGGSAITNYIIEYSADGGTTWSTFSHSASTTSSITVTGLTNGTAYEFRVSAVNATGTSAPSATANGTPTAGLTPSLSVTAGNNQSAAAGSAVAIAPSVTATDANGNPVQGLSVTFAVTTGNGHVTGTPATTSASGVATLGSWTLGNTTGANSLTAAATGYTSATINATAIPGALSATMSALAVGSTALTVGGTTTLTVTVKDAHGNTVTNASSSDVALSTDAGSIGTISCLNGVCTATFTAPASSGTATITAKIGSTNISNSPATITVTSAPGAPTALTPTVGNGQVALAWTAPASTGGSAITNYVIEYSSDGGTTWSTFSHSASTTTSITVTGLTNGTAYEFRVSAVNAVGTSSPSSIANGTPTAGLTPSLSVTAGNNQSAAAGSAVAVAPSVTATDANGNPVQGLSVAFAVTAGGGQVTGTPATTNASGVATLGSWTLGTTTGANSLSATTTGYTGATINATATPGAPSATTSTLTVGSSALTVGGTTALSVTVKDAHGNTVAAATASDITLATDVGSIGTVSCTNGVCTATFTAPASSGTATITAKIGGTSIGGSPATITVTSAPGAPTALTPTVGNGQVVLAWTAPASNGGSAITNYVVEYSADGGSTWSTFSHAASTSTSITVTGLTNGTSYEFRVSTVNAVGTSAPSATTSATPTAGLAPTLSVTAGNNQSAAAGSAVSVVPSVTATDANGSPVQGVSVTFSVTTGNGQVTGTPATTNASGVATLGSWTLGNATGANSLTAAATGYASAIINATAIPGAPSATTSTLVVGNSTLTVGDTTTLTVTVKDAHGNTVTAATASDITLGTIAGSIGTAACANGVCTATFTAPVSSGTATITAKIGGTNISGSPAPIAVRSVAGSPTGLGATVGSSQVTLSWTAPASDGGSAITNYVIEYSSDGGTTWSTFSHSPSTATSVVVTGLTNGTAYKFRVSAVNALGTSTPSSTVNGTPTAGLTPSLSVTAGNNQSAAAGSAVAVAPSVTATDANGNPVQGVSVAFAVTTGGGLVTGTPATTNASGVATLGSWTLGTTTGANSLSATATGYTSATINATATPGALSATTSTLAVGSTALTVGGTTSITVTLKDAHGNVVTSSSSSDVALSTDAGSIGTVSCVSGVCAATFTAPASAATATVSAKIGSTNISGSPATITVTSAPGAPTALTPTIGNGQVALVWTAPTSTGGSAITNYIVEYSADGGTTWSTFSHSASTATSITVTGLTNGTSYEFRVSAVNAIGTSAPSATTNATPTAGLTPSLSITAGNNQSAAAGSAVTVAPSVTATDANGNPVQGLSVTFAVTTGNGQVTGTPATTNASGVATLGSWTLGNTTGANSLSATATGYTGVTFDATATPGAASATTSTLAVGTSTLTVGGTTTITVTVKDAHGNVVTRASSSDVALSTDAGSIGTVSCVSGVCTATFTAPASAATATISAKIGTANVSGSPATITVTSAPGAPTSLSATAGASQVNLSWTAPANDGGSAITNYVVEYTSDGGTTWSTFSHSASTTTSITVTGLTNGTTYQFRVSAVNAVGTSSPSSTANGTPTAGLTPTLSVTAGNNQSAAAGSTVAIAPSVTATDANNNPVVGLTVTFSVTTGNGQVTGTPATTNASGVATLGSWTLGNATGANSLSATATGYASATINATATPGAPSATTSTLAVGTSTLTVGGTTTITVTVKDAHGNTVTAATGSDIALGADVGSIGTVSCASGVCTATFTAPAASGTATITAKIGASNISGSPATIAVTSAPGAPTALTPTIGNGQVALAWTAPTSTGGSAITNYIVEYSSDGGTTWTTFSHSASTSASITVTGLTNGTSYEFRVSAVNAVGTSSPSSAANGTPTAGLTPSLSVTAGNNQSAAAGSAVTVAPSVTATDANGNPVVGVSVTFSVASGNGHVTDATVATDAHGVATLGSWTLGTTTGANSLTAAATGYTSAVINATAIPGAASAVTSTILATPTTLTANGAATSSLTIQLKDANGNNLTSGGATIAFATPAAGSIGTVTDHADGTYTATYTAGSTPATVTIQPKLGGTNFTNTASITLEAGAASQLAITTAAAGAASGAAFTTQPVVAIHDAHGNLVSSNATVTMTVSTGGTVVGTASVAASNGIATFTDAGISGSTSSNNPYTLTFAVSGLTSATQTITLGAGAASELAIVTSAAGATNGGAFATQPVIEIRDAQGNRTSSTANVTIGVSTGASTVGTVTVAAVAGRATFSTAGISGTGGTSYTLTYSSPSLSSATQSITAANGADAQLAITTSAAGAASGSAFTTQPVVEIRDAQGFRTSSNATVTMSVSTGGSVVGTASVAAVGGVATFTNAGISGLVSGSPYTLSFGVTGITAATQSIALTAGPGAQLNIITPAASAANGAAFGTQPVIEIDDAAGNRTASTATITMSASTGASTVGTVSVAAVNGRASFADAGISGVAGTSYTLTFAGTSLTSATQSITPTAGAATHLVLTTAAAGAASGSPFTTQPVITIADASGNTVTSSTASVTMSVDSNATTVGTIAVNAVNGVATFTNAGISGAAGTSYTLSFSSTSLTGVTQNVTPTAGAASASTTTLAIGTTSLATAGTTTITVTVKDAFGNVVTSATPSDLTLATDAGSIGTVTCTNGVCTATFTAPASAGTATITAKIGTSNVSASPATITVASAPGAPTSLSATSNADGQVPLTWSAPASNGGAAITNYVVEYSANGGAAWSTFPHAASTTTSITVTGLTNGTSYTFRVSAVNAIGTGTASSTAAATPVGAPGAPTNLSATPGTAQAVLNWTAPANDGGSAITDYVIEYSGNGGTTWSVFSHSASTATSITVTGLTNGTSYTFRVSAKNASGTGAASTTTTATPGAPGAPTNVAVSLNQISSTSHTASLTWTAPASNGGSSITDYMIQYKQSSVSTWTTLSHSASTATSASITGLSNSTTYDFQVAAINSVGTGAFSAPVSATTTGPSERLQCQTNGNSNSNSTTVTVAPCSAVKVGDIIVIPIGITNSGTPKTITSADGFTALTSVQNNQDSRNEFQTTVFYKIATAADVGRAGTYSFSWSGTEKSIITLVAYKNVDGSAPSMTSATGLSATATAPSGPSMAVASHTLLYFYLQNIALSSTTPSISEWSLTSGSAVSSDLFKNTTAGANNANAIGIITADIDKFATGQTTTAEHAGVTANSGSKAWTAIVLGIHP